MRIRLKNIEDRVNIMSTKADTLNALSKVIKKSAIEEIQIVTAGEFELDASGVCSRIASVFGGDLIVVRSSSSNEDSYTKSNAGHYDSVLNVDSGDAKSVAAAIGQVIASYSKEAECIHDMDAEQVLIQRQTTDVVLSGVIFTKEIHANLPYYLISYDDNGSTDSVTSGKGGRTLMISRNADLSQIEDIWCSLIEAVREIEDVLGDSVLDIEFAVSRDSSITIFQVRPLAVSRKDKNVVDEHEFFEIKSAAKKTYGNFTDEYTKRQMILSDMAFWNPAEIIGTNPRPLDYSLYREIITKNVWSRSLVPLGYKYVPYELMYRIGNKPYISLNYSFYGLLPEKTDACTADRIVRFYSDCLLKDPTAHDKIEFEIVLSSYDFMTEKNAAAMAEYGFSEDEISDFLVLLKEMTFNAVRIYNDILAEDMSALGELEDARKDVQKKIFDAPCSADGHMAANAVRNVLADNETLVGIILDLIEKLKNCGTMQFARQARYAFIARAFCKTLVDAGYFNPKEVDDFMKSFHTVSSDFERDFALFGNGDISCAEFNEKYGHLRSGTYNIRSRRYDTMDFENIQTKTRRSDSTENSENAGYGAVSDESLNRAAGFLDEGRVKTALDSIGFEIHASQFISFLKNATEQREYFKFEFTKTLSLVIEMIALFGENTGLTRRQMSWFTVDDFKEMQDIYSGKRGQSADCDYSGQSDGYANVLRRAADRDKAFERGKKIILPEIIYAPECLDIIKIREARPNFITSKSVEGHVVVLDGNYESDIEGKIVALPQADPGYEWIFAKGIAGFITKYGGMASHMAIRCAEFGIPGAIGCGEKIYNYVCRQNYIKLDCKNGKII